MRREPLVEPAFQRLDDLFVVQFLDDLGDEGLDQKATRRLLVDAARHQVEQVAVVDLGDGGAVAALHVVGEDFELRLGRKLAVV